jgi:RNA polymerase sigma-70 factor (ECF subfamily)
LKDADTFLVEQFQAGDHAAFDVLVERHYKRIYELAYYFVRDVEDAYDITQDVFLRVFNSLANFKGDSSFYTWVYRIASNACVDYRRRRSRRQGVELTEELIQRDDVQSLVVRERAPYQQALDRELDTVIRNAVSQLPDKQRQVFILRHYEQLSLQEIATVLGRGLGTIKAHLFHATRAMRRLLAPYLDGEVLTSALDGDADVIHATDR